MRTALMSVFALCMSLGILFASFGAGHAKELAPIKLLAPKMEGGMPLMQALKERQTGRDFESTPLPMQMLSNLLWAADGINRPDLGKRTAPSAVNWQEIDIYVALPGGCYLYDAKANELKPVLAQDIRTKTGMQPFVGIAPMNLIYVADTSRMGKGSEEDKKFYAACDTGFISQNVYLFCASEGLSTVVRGAVDKEALAKILSLKPEQMVILAQTVGYPKTTK
jgi:SagB-type dehydrogenase family enzyme